MKKKLLSLLLVVCMVIGMLPVIAMAEVTNQDDFYLEYWNGESGKNHWTGISVAPGETEYLVQTEVDSDGYSHLITDGASADNYVIKVVYPVGEAPTVYFNGLDIVQPGSYGILFERDGTDGNGWTSNSDMNLVIEADSSITIDGEGTYGAIEFYCTETTTISSVDGAKLTAYGEDCTEGDATIWARGDLVIDGAVLDIEADEGYAIGAADTISIIESDVTAASEKETAFNSNPYLEGEMVAIAATTNLPNDDDLVAYDAAAWDTYKYVHIGADVTLPEIGGGEGGGEGGGDVDTSDLEDFRFEFWNGSGWTDLNGIAQGSETLYFAQTEADASGYSHLVATEDTDNYVLKIEYPEDEEPTVYFNGLNMVQPFGWGLLFESANNSLDVNLVIEKDSYYEIASENYYGGIECYTSGTFTISSVVDPETGKLATLTMYGEDTGDGNATIWHRGDLVIDGAALDISADEGHAIGAAGTITVKDSDVVAWSEKELAFNKAVTVEGELDAIASTTHVPNDEDLVEYDAAAWDTYKFVKIGAKKVEPADVVTEAWDIPELTLGQAKYYVIDANGALTEVGASAESYKVAYIYEENGRAIYLNGVTMENAAPIYFDEEVDTLNIVVQADSSLSSVGGTRPAICVTNVGDVTILSLNDAVLTVKSKGVDGSLDYTAIWGSQTAGTIQTDGNLTLKDAFVNVEFFGAEDYIINTAGIFVYNADLTINNSVVNIGKGHSTVSMTSPLQLVGEGSDLVIENGSNVTLMNTTAQRPIRYDGALTISDSNFEAGSTDIASGRRIFRDTLPTITGNVTIVGSTAAPTIDPANFTMTAPADTAEVDPTTLISTKYYYIKITVNEEEPAPEYNFQVSVTYNETLDMNFYIPAEAIGDATAWTIMNNGVALAEGEYTLVRMNHKDYGDVYRVRATYFANQMNNVLSVSCADAEGNVIATRSMSIAEYGMKVLAAYSSNTKLCALMVAMLNYGSLAQINMDDTAPLANKDLTAQQHAYLNDYTWPTNAGEVEKATQASTATKFKISVTYNETLDMNFYLDAAAVGDGAVWTITNNGVALTEDQYTLVRMNHKDYGDVYRVRVTYYANQMNSLLSVTCENADGLIAQRSMSIAEYGMKVLEGYSSNAKLCALMVAMLDYGALAQINMNDTAPLANKDLTAQQREYVTNYTWPTAG